MLTGELGMAMERTEPASESDLRGSIDSAVQQLRSLATAIQGISRRLHASHLEYLGLASAAGALCREFGAQQNVEIDFRCDPVLPRLDRDVSLSFYRVLQEALQNAIKHSGVRAFKVELTGTDSEMRLSVSDEGVGFDPEREDKHHGLGLLSMRERMRLVRGEFALESQPGMGTTIRCRVRAGVSTPSGQVEHDGVMRA
jgi:two-component system NarL family sensor kinase